MSAMIRRCLPLLLSSLALVVFFAPPVVAQSAGDAPELFKDAAESPSALNRVGQQRMNTLEQESTTQSIRLVSLAEDLSQQRAMTMQVDRGTRVLAPSVSPAFQRNSENEGSSGRMVELSIQRDRINAISEGTYAWMGSVQFNSTRGEETVGDVTLVRGVEGEISGTIRIGGEYYLVRPLNGNLHALVNVDESKYPSGGNSPLHDGGSSRKASQPASTSKTEVPTSPSSESSSEASCSASTAPLVKNAPDTGKANTSTEPRAENTATAPCSQIATDALVVYTSAAASNTNNIDNRINTAIQEANDAYNNSNSYNADLSLAHSQQVQISGIGTGTINNDLNDLQTSGTVQSLRDQHDADVVVLLTDNIYNYAGLADEIRAEAEDAYAIVAAQFAAGGLYTLGHEVGHLQGGQHHPNDGTCPEGDSNCDPEGHIFPDAYGHRFDNDKWWCGWLCGPEYATMMAYQPGDYSRIKHFSNPNVNHDGKQTGTSSRYNADALQTTASTVEDFRISNELRASMTVSGTPGDSERTFTAAACGGTGSYSYAWRISYNGPGNYGPPVSSQESFTNTFPEGTHYVKLTASSGSQSDTAIRSIWVQGECSNPPCPILDSTPDSLTAKTATTDESPMTQKPKRVALRGAAPNPFRSSTEIVYALPERTGVTLTVYDLMGRRVATLASGTRGASVHRVRLDGTSLPSGSYVVRLRAGGQQKTRRITVVK